MIWLILLTLKSFGVLIGLLFVMLMWRHMKMKKTVKFYSDQGFYTLPGYDAFPLGNIDTVIRAAKEKEKRQQFGGDVLPMQLVWMMDQSTESKKIGSFDYTKNENVIINTGGVQLLISDPNIVQEMMVNKNAQLDKTGQFIGIFKNFFGNSFLFSKSDD